MTAPGAARIPTVRPDRETVPRALLRAIGVLLTLCLIMVAAARITGMEPVASPPPSSPDQVRRILIETAPGGVTVTDVDTGGTIAELHEQAGGFVGGVERAVARERLKHGVPRVAPVELIRWRDGRLSLLDPSTGWRIELRGFGQDNFAAFAALLHAPAPSNEGDES